MGGGTQEPHAKPGYPKGLSPRGRGNLFEFTDPLVPIGSIPAWAGEPATTNLGIAMAAVYPRVGGGTRGGLVGG